MRHIRLLYAAAFLAGAPSFLPSDAAAQGHDWFVPGQPRSAQPAPPARAGSRQSPARSQAVPPPSGAAEIAPAPALEPEQPATPLQVQLPPAPDVPALPKSAPPPPAVVGVLSLAEISRGSAAAQQVDKTLSERVKKLHDDAQKEQAAWREVQQQLAAQRASLSADQIRAKERDLQERVTNAQRQFRDRNRVIQEAAQYSRAQIERTLRQVVVQVAESRGINLVLHQEQVVLNYPAFDITQPVVEELNKVLPAVIVPPDGVLVSQMPGAVPAPAPGAPAVAAAAKPGSEAASAPSSASPPPASPPAPSPAAPATTAPAPAAPPKRP